MVSHRAGLSATAGLSCYTRISLLRDGFLCLYSNHNIMLGSSRCIVGILYFSILTAFHTLSLHLHFPLRAPAAASPYNGQNHNHSSIARYHGTTAAPRYHFSTVPVPSALWYYLVPQYYNYRGSSARYCPMLTHSNEHLLDCIQCIVFGLKLQSSACPPLSFTAKLHTLSLLILCWPNE